MSAIVDFFVSSATTGLLLPGLVDDLTFAYFRRREADGSVTDLAGLEPDFEDRTGGAYGFTVPTSALLPGTAILYAIDCTAAAAARLLFGTADSALGGGEFSEAIVLVGGGEVLLSEGDRAPPDVFQLVDAAGQVVDLTTGNPVVKLYMRPAGGGTPVIDGVACAIVDAANGKVLYAWRLLDTATAGQFLAQFVLEQAGLESTYPPQSSFIVRVAPRLV